MARTIALSVVIPAYNEEDNLKKGILDSIDEYLQKQNVSWEVLFVDDGSSDNTKSLIKKFIKSKTQYSLIENKHQGKAATVTTGMLNATGSIILFSDFDQATPLSEVEKLLPSFDTYDIVIGSRSNQRKGAPFSRKLMAKGFMLLRNILLGLGVEDTQCGFKAFKKQAAHTLFKKLKLHKKPGIVSGSRVTAGFDVELLYLAKKHGYSVKEVPVVWNYVETRRVSPIRDSWDGLVDLLRIKFHDLRGTYR